MAVKVAMKVKVEPRAPSMPAFLFQKPRSSNVPKVHSEVPRRMAVPRMPKTGNCPGDQRTVGNYGQQSSDLQFEPFVVPEPREDNHHCGAEQVIIDLQEARAAEKAER